MLILRSLIIGLSLLASAAHALETTPADRPCGSRDDAFVAEFLAAGQAVHSRNDSR